MADPAALLQVLYTGQGNPYHPEGAATQFPTYAFAPSTAAQDFVARFLGNGVFSSTQFQHPYTPASLDMFAYARQAYSYVPAQVQDKQSKSKSTTGGTAGGEFSATPYSPLGEGKVANAPGSNANTSYSLGDLASGPDEIMRWADLINQASRATGVPANIIAATMYHESDGQNVNGPKNSQGDYPVGLMQVMTFNANGRDLTDPYTNILAGAQMLKDGYDRYGTWDKAAAYYFGGPGAIKSDGSYGDARDYANGSTIPEYVQAFENDLQKFGVTKGNTNSNVGASPAAEAGGSYAYSVITGGQGWDVTQPFGPTDLSGEPAYGGYAHYHMGVDLGVPTDTPIYAPTQVKIVQVDRDPNRGYGYSVVFQDANGYTVRIGHMHYDPSVSVGDVVSAGSELGLSDSTGYSTGPHVHLEVHDPQGNVIDPTTYFNGF